MAPILITISTMAPIWRLFQVGVTYVRYIFCYCAIRFYFVLRIITFTQSPAPRRCTMRERKTCIWYGKPGKVKHTQTNDKEFNDMHNNASIASHFNTQP